VPDFRLDIFPISDENSENTGKKPGLVVMSGPCRLHASGSAALPASFEPFWVEKIDRLGPVIWIPDFGPNYV
jgi:hypothetical protein